MQFVSNRQGYRLSPIALALAALVSAPVYAEELPPGFHKMPDGRIMANNPATAIAPPGYYLRSNGILIKLEEDVTAKPEPVPAPQAQDNGGVPPGFHLMPDGRIMANNPSTAVAPAGYHLMPDGTLMSNSGGGGGDSGAHAHHHGHHGQGMWMFEYRYTHMYMKDMLDTNIAVEPINVFSTTYGAYMMSPTEMTMDMHMFMAMYGVTNNITAMAMLHYMSNSMGMTTLQQTNSTMESSGLGDTVLTLLYSTPYNVVLGLGGGLPTGSIDEKGDMVMDGGAVMTGVTLPYGMQLGSGSFELRPSIKYSQRFGDFTVGSSFEYIYRLNTNAAGYKLGNRGELAAFGEWHASRYFSVTGRGSFTDTEQIEGAHEDISLTMNHDGMDMLGSPAADPSLYGGMRVDGTLGIKANTADRMWGLRTEVTIPIYQNLWGPQMRTRWVATLALEAMF